IDLSGTLTDFKNPTVDIEASSPNVDFDKIRPFIADILEKYKITPGGVADLTLSYIGRLDPPNLAKISVEANLKDASLKSEKIPEPITNISGKVSYSSQGATWQKLKGT